MPHPNFVPVMPSTSRKVQRSRVSSGTSTVTVLPFTFSVVLIGCQLSRINDELRERYATGAATSFELLRLRLRRSPSARCRKRAQIRQDGSARIRLCFPAYSTRQSDGRSAAAAVRDHRTPDRRPPRAESGHLRSGNFWRRIASSVL